MFAVEQNNADMVLQAIINNEGITAKQIADRTSLSLIEVRKEIKHLKDRVEFRGAKKSGGYFYISQDHKS